MSSVRRRYSEFVWLRRCLEKNALIIDLPKLPSWNPFFSLRRTEQVLQRMKGMEEFLENVLHTPLLLSDSRLHLFLQSDLSITKIEKCAQGKTRYTVAEAIQRSNTGCVDTLEDKASCDSDCESATGQPCKLKADERKEGSLKQTAAVPLLFSPLLPLTAELTWVGPTANLACPMFLSSSLLPLDGAVSLCARAIMKLSVTSHSGH
ncbi:uncharacterized protein V6R79_020996 [Siganus canaliculatus]